MDTTSWWSCIHIVYNLVKDKPAARIFKFLGQINDQLLWSYVMYCIILSPAFYTPRLSCLSASDVRMMIGGGEGGEARGLFAV